MGSSQPWKTTVHKLIDASRSADEPVWVDQTVREIMRQHPDCGMTEAQLADAIRNTVIDERWSLAGG